MALTETRSAAGLNTVKFALAGEIWSAVWRLQTKVSAFLVGEPPRAWRMAWDGTWDSAHKNQNDRERTLAVCTKRLLQQFLEAYGALQIGGGKVSNGKRRQIRSVETNSIIEKKFERIVKPSREMASPLHPLLVVYDMQKGSLKSLEKYLAKHKGIPDREIALELRKLISGSRQRSKHRLLVVEHPDNPKSKGGRPKAEMREPTKAEYEAAQLLRERSSDGVESAVAYVSSKMKIEPRTVYKYYKFVGEYEAQQMEKKEKSLESRQSREAMLQLRKTALSRLRAERDSPSD